MAGPFTETFTAADGTAVSALTGWAVGTGATSPVVTSNAYRPAGGTDTNVGAAYYNTAVASAHYAKAKFTANGSAAGIGPAIRVQSGENSFFYCLRDTGGNTYNGHHLNGVAPDPHTATDWDSGQAGVVVNDVIELSVDTTTSTTVYFKKNGSTVATYTSRSALSGGYVGVSTYNTDTAHRADDWEGGDVLTGPTITDQPDSVAKFTGETAQFSVTATGTGTLTYQWQKDTGSGYGDIGSATSSSYTTPTLGYSDDGDFFRCNVTDDGGTTASNGALLTVIGAANTGWFRA